MRDRRHAKGDARARGGKRKVGCPFPSLPPSRFLDVTQRSPIQKTAARETSHSLTLRSFASRLRELSQRASLAFRNGEFVRRLHFIICENNFNFCLFCSLSSLAASPPPYEVPMSPFQLCRFVVSQTGLMASEKR